MSEDFKPKSVDIRMRSWLVRRICGRHSYDKLATKVDKVVLHATIETLHKTITNEVSTMLSKSVSQLPAETLAQCISANQHLSDLQKTQIANIIQSPSNIDHSRLYLQ
jgi:hypothetical protein